MKQMKMFIIDGLRLVQSLHLLYGILGICLYIMATHLEDMQGDSAVYLVTQAFLLMGFLLTIMIAYEVFGNCFIEDFKNKYIYQIILREGNIFFYTVSKTFWIFVSAMLSVAFGILLFTCICKIGHPWIDEFTEDFSVTPFGKLYQDGHYMTYLFLAGLQFGILAGMMAMVGSLVSLFIKNKLLAGASTVVAVFTCNLIKGIFWHEGVNMFQLFLLPFNWLYQAKGWTSHCIKLGLLFYLVGTILIYIRIKWRLRHE